MHASTRELIELARQLGFTLDRYTGSGHYTLTHPNGTTTIPSTPSDYRGRKNTIAQLERIAGRRLPRANHRRSRKADELTGFTPERAAREARAWHEEHDADVDALLARRERLIEECRELASKRGRLRDIPDRLVSIAAVEEQLARMAQPVTPFDPYTLAR